MEQAARARLDRLVPADAVTWCKPDKRIVVGKAYRGILNAAHEAKADLIVMGVLGRNAVDLMLFGSTTHHVVREATCPVLTVRAGA
jgi:nucleotide-binding universal stress UspA family protein